MGVARHTAGPWRLAEVTCGNLIIEGGNHRSLAVFQTKGLDRGGWAYNGHIANGALMASAPEMFDYIQRRATRGCVTAKALIAKATTQ